MIIVLEEVIGISLIVVIGIVAVVVVVPLIVLAILYNILVSKRNQVDNAFASVDVHLKKRYDLIPNLVETVKGYASHEKEVFLRVTEARASMANATNVGEKSQANNLLESAVKSLFAVAENYPQLKASENFLHLQAALTEVEEQLSAARRAYNASVLEYNNAVEMFPTNIAASMTGHKRRQFFEISQDEKRVPDAPASLNR